MFEWVFLGLVDGIEQNTFLKLMHFRGSLVGKMGY